MTTTMPAADAATQTEVHDPAVLAWARAVLDHMGLDVEFEFDPSKPTGPYNRVSDDTLCRQLLGWSPQVSFLDGLHATIDWYVQTHDASVIRESLEHLLTERRHQPVG